MAAVAARMKALLGPFVLRRLKTEVADQLAPKLHILRTVPMAERQASLYASAIATLRSEAHVSGMP